MVLGLSRLTGLNRWLKDDDPTWSSPGILVPLHSPPRRRHDIQGFDSESVRLPRDLADGPFIL